MAFPKLYSHLLTLWPDQIDLSDGALLEHKNPFLALGKLKGQQNISAGTEHFYSEKFSMAWQKTEEAVRNDDILGKLLLWSMYQIYHRHAQQLFAQGKILFCPAQVNCAEVEEQFIKNLREPGYEEERAAYEKLLP